MEASTKSPDTISEIFKELFDYDFDKMEADLDVKCFSILENYQNVNAHSKVFNKRIRDRICGLGHALGDAGNVEAFQEILTQFYKEFGVGKLGLHKAFRVEHPEDDWSTDCTDLQISLMSIWTTLWDMRLQRKN